MAEDKKEFILEILEDLETDEMSKLKMILNAKKIQGCKIPSSKLENLDAKKATYIIVYYYEKPLEAVMDCLDGIPRKDLIQKINAKTEADMKNKDKVQNNEKFPLTKSCSGSSDQYAGNYTLFDLEKYATKNQEQLIKHLENILEPDELNALKKELMHSVLNKSFSFTALKYYDLFKNNELKEFLKNISGKPKKIPMKLLNVLFSKENNNCKRKGQDHMQREGNTNLKKNKFDNIDDNDGNVPDKNTLQYENEKTIPIPPTEHKPGNIDNNVLDKYRHRNENEKINPSHPNVHKPGNIDDDNVPDKDTLQIANEKINPIHQIQPKPGNENSNVIEKHCQDRDSIMAIEKWRENKKKNNYSERISLNYISIHEHQTYSCFTAHDILQFRMPNESDDRILAILQDKRDFTNSQKLKKEVEFALQFNMAVVGVPFSEAITSNGFVREIQANDSFAESEFFFKSIVSEIILPVLALYKWVQLNAFHNAVYPNKKKQIFSQ
ncbi:uncharacterized protein [Erythrolamprus reginae]|uniref:uncharacterized protein n=1 Tax=Erythrolamprus reginae TaxID=121349 RepID=UPI00396D022B